MGDYEEGVVEVLVKNWLSEDGTSETSGNEERDEAKREEHRGGVLRTAAPGGCNPTEDLGRGGQGDGHGRDREGRAGEGVETGDEHVVSPEEYAEQTDEQSGSDHRAISKDAAVAEVCQEHRCKAHTGKDGDVDLGMSKEPEEMEPEERASVAFCVKNSVDEVSSGKEEAGSSVAVA